MCTTLLVIGISIETIISWMAHLLRGVKQNEFKQHAISMINESTGLWLTDWVQKIIPVSFREGQKDYFGKKGMSLSIDVLFTKSSDGNLKKSVYHTIIYRCDQDILDTLCVSQHVLNQIKRDFPNLTSLYRRSDNAGCYAGNSVAEF